MSIDTGPDKKLAMQIWQATQELSFRSDARTTAAARCFQLALEHHASIVLLVESNQFGSALALLRPTLEAYIRGLWLARKASDRQLQHYMNDGTLKISNLISEVETLPIYAEPKFRTWSSIVTALHSYTHSGVLAIQFRYSDLAIEPAYSDEAIEEVLRFSREVASFTAAELIELSENGEGRIDQLESIVDTLKQLVSPSGEFQGRE